MSRLPFRDTESTPIREYSGPELSNYRHYKKFLRKDFKEKCGYTSCLDVWFGGANTFHIDHFVPKSKRPELSAKYSNLVYCCSYVNRAKGDDEGLYLDPCNDDYNEHFYRTDEGEICPVLTSPRAVYMHRRLKLYLKRYSIIWMLEQLDRKLFQLEDLIRDSENIDAKELYVEVSRLHREYRVYLRVEQ